MTDPNHIQKASARFMNILLDPENPKQINEGEATDKETHTVAKNKGDFKEIFPKLNALSKIWDTYITGGTHEESGKKIKTYPLRALLSDSTFHTAINNGTNITNDDLEQMVGKKIFVNELLQNISIENNDKYTTLAKENKGKELFCDIYNKLSSKLEPISGGSKEINITIASGTGRRAIGITAEEITNANIDEKNVTNLVNYIFENNIYKKLEFTNNDFKKLDEPTKKNIVIEVMTKCIKDNVKISPPFSDIDPNKILAILENEKLYKQKKELLSCIIEKFNNGTLLQNASITFNTIVKERIDKPTTVKPTTVKPKTVKTEPSKTPIISGPKELELISNYEIKSFISDKYGIYLYDVVLDDCGDKEEITKSIGSNTNSHLSSVTPPNCFTNGSDIRVSPWIKHESPNGDIGYYLVCQCCGLPMFPENINTNSSIPLTNEKYKKYFSDNILSKINKIPNSKEELEEYAGITQCDHTAPLAMMFFGLNKTATAPFGNIGIGTNFCPLHPSCNTKKLNISPLDYWNKNEPRDDLGEFTWNTSWTNEGDKSKQKYPSGPWKKNPQDTLSNTPELILSNINYWCQQNKWNPRYYAKLLQWKYLSAIEELVKVNSKNINSFEEQIISIAKRASNLYDSISLTKEEVSEGIEASRKGPHDFKNFILSKTRAIAAHELIHIHHKAQIEDLEKERDIAKHTALTQTTRANDLEKELAELRQKLDASKEREEKLEKEFLITLKSSGGTKRKKNKQTRITKKKCLNKKYKSKKKKKVKKRTIKDKYNKK